MARRSCLGRVVVFFSVIIPAYNRERLIGVTLDSALAQSFKDYEIIVVDDGSTDATVGVVRGYGERVRLVEQKNAGPGVARNLGIATARGEYVAFLDSDDVWFPWTLETYARVIREHGSPAVVMGKPWPFVEEGEAGGVVESALRVTAFEDLLAGSRSIGFWGSNVAVIRRESVAKVGGFCAQRINGEDLDLFYRLGTERGYLRVEEPYTVGYRRHGGNVSHDAMKTELGMRYLLEQERQGRYAGGRERKKDRVRMLSYTFRNNSWGAAGRGDVARALWLYRVAFWWNVRVGKWAYVAGFPVVAAWKAIRKGGA